MVRSVQSFGIAIVALSAVFSGQVSAATDMEMAATPSPEQVKECRNANTLIFQRASFFSQANTDNVMAFPGYGYRQRPERGIVITATSADIDDARAATRSLNSACERDPHFRLKNPAEESGSYVGVKPRLDSPRFGR